LIYSESKTPRQFCHGNLIKPSQKQERKEKSWLVQDDGGTLMPDGSFHGFEGGGIFVKTENVGPGEQMEKH